MKKIITLITLLFFSLQFLSAQVPKQLVLVGTGYGFDRTASNGINPGMWSYFQKWASLSYNGQDASPTAIRLHVQWEAYEPTVGNYHGAKLAQAVAAIRSLKPGMKVALHFAYQRPGPQPGQSSEGYLADNEIARIYDGTKVEQTITYTIPSMYSQTAKTKFLNFVNNAMASVSAYYSDILYVEMGNGDAEEFIMPIFKKNDYYYPGFYEDAALQAWRTEYLPCRYPSQSNVTWNGTQYSIASAPSYSPQDWAGWDTEHGREYHRFASWGLMRMYKQFRDVVKANNSSVKVLMFEPGFGTTAGNIHSMHNSILPMSQNEFDGTYSTEGERDDTFRKILPLDVLKGTNPNKIAAIEFDPHDLGATVSPSRVIGIYPGVAAEWIPRAYKHGADYVHLAMNFFDSEIDQMAPVIAAIKPVYLNGTYQSPARQAPVTVNIFPTSFTGTYLFESTWNSLGANNWASTDASPKSINMIDNGYWENIWSCSNPPPCDFNMTASTTTPSPAGGASVTLNSSCSGGSCSGLTYAWSGNGISGSGSSVTFNAPSTPNTYTYTLTTSKSGCPNKTATVQITVGGSCDFTVSAGNSNGTPAAGATLNLTYSCSGTNCSGVTYAWSGNGISGSGTPKSITAPATAGTYTYTITASKSGCTNKTATTSITVPGGPAFNQCLESESMSGNGNITSDPNASNGSTRGEENNYNHYVDYALTGVPSAGTYAVTLRYYSSAPPVVSVQVNGGSGQTVNLANSNSWNISWTTQTFNVTLAAGNNTLRISGTSGGSCRQDRICVSGTGCTPPSAPSLSASPASISTGGSSTLSASGCGGTVTWSDGLGTGTSKSVSPSSTKTYTATCSVGGCTSNNASVTVTVTGCTPPSAPSLSASPSTITSGSSSTLTASGCGGTVTWSDGLGTGTSKSVSPTSTKTYTAMCTVSGCTSSNGSVTVTVTPGTFNQCLESESMSGNGAITSDPNASNGSTRGEEISNNHYVDYAITGAPSAGTYYVTLRYYSSAAPVVSVTVNGSGAQTVNLANSNSWNIAWTTQTFTVTLPSGNSTLRIQGTGGGSCRQDRICVSNTSGSPAMLNPLNPDEIVNLNAGKGLLISPNPGRGIFQTRFYLATGKKASIIVTDVQGRTVHQQYVTGKGMHNERIDLTNKASGTLFMRLQKTDGVEVKKINIVR